MGWTEFENFKSFLKSASGVSTDIWLRKDVETNVGGWDNWQGHFRDRLIFGSPKEGGKRGRGRKEDKSHNARGVNPI